MHLYEWLNFLVRWAHLIFGISWIGSSFYFMWLDSSLEKPVSAEEREEVEGELWMTHSGGFYQVQRRIIAPGSMPAKLHWFKYEALFTWISGVFLLGLVYYLSGGAFLIDPTVADITPGTATLLSLGVIIVSWLIYDLLWVTLGNRFPTMIASICLALAAGLAYGLCQIYSGRGAFIHLGAVFGTIMVANVWVRILPSQQKMIDATEAGRAPDLALSAQAKRRSVHNSYMTFPVIFTMISNHYSIAYAHALNWVVLLLLVGFGVALRHVMLAKNTGGKVLGGIATLVTAIAMVVITGWQPDSAQSAMTSAEGTDPTARVGFQQVQNVIQSRCVACHSNEPTDATFGPAPGGVQLDRPEHIKRLVDRIHNRVVVTKTMPIMNKTGMTDEERALIARWIKEGAPVDE